MLRRRLIMVALDIQPHFLGQELELAGLQQQVDFAALLQNLPLQPVQAREQPEDDVIAVGSSAEALRFGQLLQLVLYDLVK